MTRSVFLVTDRISVTSEMEFSDRVDMVFKKSHGKISKFRKVTAFLKSDFFFGQKKGSLGAGMVSPFKDQAHLLCTPIFFAIFFEIQEARSRPSLRVG